jgi:sec-independent protein translocase protein TatB
MSSVGFSELLLLFLIGLIVLGPERLPRVANQLGTWIGQARRMTRVMKRQLEDELNFEEKQHGKTPPFTAKPVYVTPANDTDDKFSPRHGPQEKGTGVGDTTPEENLAATDQKNLDDDVASALPPASLAEQEKIS